MARKNPLGKIKDVAVGTVKAPVTAAGSAVGLAKGAASAGGTATKTATGKAAGAVTSLVGRKGAGSPDAPATEQESPLKSAGKQDEAAPKADTAKQDTEAKPAKKAAAKKTPAKKSAAKEAPAKKSAAKKAPAKAKKTPISPTEPVNVTEELGLDPAPVEQPKAPKTPEPKPVTKIDAEADASDVDVTPADIAGAVSQNEPGKA